MLFDVITHFVYRPVVIGVRTFSSFTILILIISEKVKECMSGIRVETRITHSKNKKIIVTYCRFHWQRFQLKTNLREN